MRNAVRTAGRAAQRVERLGVRPRGVAGALDAPHRQHVVDAAQRVVGDVEQAVEELLLDVLLDPGEDRVDAAEVAVLGRAALGLEPALEQRGDERDRQVVVDVGVHARQRELQRRHARAPARVEQRPPRVAGARRVDRGEVQVGEHDVEPGEERRVLELARRSSRAGRRGSPRGRAR